MDRTMLKNGFTNRELLLLGAFVKYPAKTFTLSEIMHFSKNKSYHYVYEALKKFAAKKIICEELKGNTNVYCLDCDAKDFGELCAIEAILKNTREDIPYNILNKVTEKIKCSFYSLLIAGSYAESKQKPKSDLDVAIIIPDGLNKKPFEIALKEGELTIPEIHGFVFTESEFYQMLTNEEYNYGKECARKHILFYGAETYYKILFKAIKNGFKG